MTVRSSHLIFVFWEQILIFFSPVYTTQKCPPHHARKTMAARDLDCQREDRSSKFRHFSTNDRAEFTSDVRISGTSSHFFSPAYTTHKFPSDHARKTAASRDLDYQRQGPSSKFRDFSTADGAEFTSYVRISLSTSNFLLPAYTVRKRAPHRTRKTVAARDLQCQCQGQNLKFRHFSTNHRAEFPSNIRISGTNSYFLFTRVHYTQVSFRSCKKDSCGA